MKRTPLQFLSFMITSVPLLAHSEIDLLNGALIKESEDNPLPHKVRSRRSYSSRSLHRGIFGFGWCSDLEKKLTTAKDKLLLYDCHSPDPIEFTLEPGLTPQRDASPTYRSELKREWITKSKNGYRLDSHAGHLASFDHLGRLTEVTQSARKIQIEYTKDSLIKTVKAGSRETENWKWDQSSSQVISITTAEGQKIQFEYLNEDLVKVSSSQNRKIEKYQYSQSHNMISSESLEQKRKTSETYIYDESKDTLNEVRKYDSCTERLTYLELQPTEQITKYSLQCPHKKNQVKTIRFRFRAKNSQQTHYRSLEQIELTHNKRTQVYTFSSGSQSLSFQGYDRRNLVGAAHE